MKDLLSKKNILWDFDGVILDSMNIRTEGFKQVLINYPDDQVESLLVYHRRNGGLSRYVKFRYFFEHIRQETAEKAKLQKLAENYSKIMRSFLTSPERLVPEVIDFIRKYFQQHRMYIVSGSDGNELRFLCKELGIEQYFVSVEGSPTPKIQLVRNILEKNLYKKEETCLVGDSVNDLEAAEKNGIKFFGYNNEDLKEKADYYLNSFR
ncbi:HAD family hydrolase [Salinimicrobium oceani]|uniref:phosphoglycolate phosphatase n=1 Tax=Salinimicrobium oceani TaxID=2722702 RepID=A0ABX1D3Z3_9FLAO|nr:HAD-IA family hydrolase [Salinimicrobium oceani]NJW53423.1 HAD family hydrolase [Salinimicrobium oceani]